MNEEDLKEELIRLTYENNELKSQMNELTDRIRELDNRINDLIHSKTIYKSKGENK